MRMCVRMYVCMCKYYAACFTVWQNILSETSSTLIYSTSLIFPNKSFIYRFLSNIDIYLKNMCMSKFLL